MINIYFKYIKWETDELITTINLKDYNRMKDGDSFIFFSFREDRTGELSKSLGEKYFNGFNRNKLINFS